MWTTGQDLSATCTLVGMQALPHDEVDALARLQAGVVSRRQLRALGVDADAIAARTGADGRDEPGPEVLAAAVSGAARVAAERWLRPESDTTFSVVLNDALTWVAPALRAADH